jgi:hypothetical protein
LKRIFLSSLFVCLSLFGSVLAQSEKLYYQLWAPYFGLVTYKYKDHALADRTEWYNSHIEKDMLDLNLISLPPYIYDAKRDLVSYPALDLLGVNYSPYLNEKQKLDTVKINNAWSYTGYDPDTLKESPHYEVKVIPEIRKDDKYEHTTQAPFFKLAKVSNRVANKIFPEKYKLKTNSAQEEKSFWKTVFNSDREIFFVEGQKKAIALLSEGFISIGFRGSCRVFEYNEQKDGSFKVELLQSIKKLLKRKKRLVYLVFDTDFDEWLRVIVKNNEYHFGKLIEPYVKEVRFVEMPRRGGKAPDDYIAWHGLAAFKKLVVNYINFEEFKKKYTITDINQVFRNAPFLVYYCFNRDDDPIHIEKYIEAEQEKYDSN